MVARTACAFGARGSTCWTVSVSATTVTVATVMSRPFTTASDPARGGCGGLTATWRGLADVLGAPFGAPCGFRAGAGGSVLASTGAGYAIPGSLIGGSGLEVVVCALATVGAAQRTIQASPRARRGCIIETSHSRSGSYSWAVARAHALRSGRGCSCSSWPNRVSAQPKEPDARGIDQFVNRASRIVTSSPASCPIAALTPSLAWGRTSWLTPKPGGFLTTTSQKHWGSLRTVLVGLSLASIGLV